jgi:hypothetical protein
MQELETLKAIDDLFGGLEDSEKSRALQWLASKYVLPLSPTISSAMATTPSLEHQTISMTPKAVATILNANSGTDLVQSAAAYLAIIKQSETFTRAQLLDTMKAAIGFYKPTYRNNLTAYIDTLCKNNVLIEISPSTFTLKSGPATALHQRLSTAM